MVFNSLTFGIFFTIFFLLYWFVFSRNLKQQNILLLVASYFFYGWIKWQFLFFLIAVSAINFLLGIYIHKTKNPGRKELLLLLGLIQGIGGLALLKYSNFLITSVNETFSFFKLEQHFDPLNILIPVGISFFTFRTISYLLDIDRGKITPCNDWVIFFAYVAFFPSLLSGPIDKAKMFIPQLEKERVFDYNSASDAMRQILWGLFKKLVIADNCTGITQQIFDNYHILPGSSLLLGAFLYTMEIYADFSGYSDMAIGFSRLIGFRITKNFDFPFFSQNIAEYWSKWHISLTSWLTEYVFTPLSISFRNFDKAGLILAIVVNFTICGIWHGPNWTYVLFGFLHGCYFIPLILSDNMNKKKQIAKGRLFPSPLEALRVLGTFTLVMLTFVIFKADSVSQAFGYYANLFSISLFSSPVIEDTTVLFTSLLFIATMLCAEWLSRNKNHALENFNPKWSKYSRHSFYILMVVIIVLFQGKEQPFIYFKF